MRRWSFVLIGMIAAVSLAMSACGGGNEVKVEQAASGKVDCSGSGIAVDQLKLPADFPQPGELTITEATTAGPSQVLNGYWTADLQETYDEWHQQLDGAGYSVLFDEIEDEDAEISYKSADASSTGQIALRSDCQQADTTDVHITNRPE